MPDAFPLGSIPPLSAWEGQALNLTVTSTLGERTRFVKRAIPSPKWPTCPVGRDFDDRILVNGTSSELTISEIRIGNNVIPAQVNEPQGGSRVKLSFERLNLLPGEATKLSVCLNNEARQIEFTEFGFQTGGEQYYVTFDVNRLPTPFKKGGNFLFKGFDVDTDNRVLTFARP